MRLTKMMLVLATLAAVGCGSGGDGTEGSGHTAAFVGVWSATSGTTTITCPGLAPSVSQVAEPETWAAGTTSDLVQTIPGTSCVFHADITASTATGASQTCTISGGSTTEVVTFSSYTFSLSADHLTASENYSGSLVITDNGSGQVLNCMITQTASYAKQ